MSDLIFRDVQKATHPRPAESLAILRIAHDAEAALQRLFLRAVAAVRNGVVLKRVRDAIERGDLQAAYDAIPWTQYGESMLRDLLPTQLRDVYERAADAAASAAQRELGIGVRFDVTNPRAVEFIRNHSAELIREFGLSNQETIRALMQRSFVEGIDPYKTARLIRDSGIGLTKRQALAVERYRVRLENATEIDLTNAQVEARAQRYADRLLRLRAQNIARTETIRASAQGQLELWREARDKGLIGFEAMREWVTAVDERSCSLCLDLDGKMAPLYGTFEGGYDAPPAHPSCRCAQNLWPSGKKR